MKEFIKKILLFSFPLLLVFALPVMLLILGREYFSVSQVIKTQEQHPEALFGFVYNGQSFVPFKQALVENTNPEIIALGTSRVMQFRKEFFVNQNSFVNAGGGVKNLYDVESFIQNLPATTDVKTILLGLDQDMFTSKEKSLSYVPQDVSSFDVWKQVLFTNTRKIYIDYAHKKFSIAQLIEKRKGNSVGIAAITGGDGFREDGSYRYGRILGEADMVPRVSQQVQETISNMKYGRYASFKTSGYEEQNIEALRSVLALAKSKHIEIVGFFPPYPKALYLYMKNDGKFADTINTLPQKVKEVFDGAGAVFADLSDIRSFAGRDEEFVDNIHASDKMHIRMLLKISADSPSLKKYIDVKILRTMLDSNKGNILTF